MMNTDSGAETVSRRHVLRTGAATAGILAVGSMAVSGTAAAGKRGGRAQVDGDVLLNEPFTVSLKGTSMRNASCMSANSAPQTYLEYDIEYCNDDGTCTMYLIPDEAGLSSDGVYELHSAGPCRATDLVKVAFGPSNDECGGS